MAKRNDEADLQAPDRDPVLDGFTAAAKIDATSSPAGGATPAAPSVPSAPKLPGL